MSEHLRALAAQLRSDYLMLLDACLGVGSSMWMIHGRAPRRLGALAVIGVMVASACRPTVVPNPQCDLLQTAKVPPTSAATLCQEPTQSPTPLCVLSKDCLGMRTCALGHAAASLPFMATWRSNFTDGVGSQYMIVGETIGSAYRTRMLELQLVSGYDLHQGRTTGPTRVTITECLCSTLVDAVQPCTCDDRRTVCEE